MCTHNVLHSTQEITMTSFPVTVQYLDQCSGTVKASTRIFFNERAANKYMVEEMKWEDTVRVICLPLGVDVEGDFCGVAHSF
jgi:hypothetical protein